ncbi:MAG: hypothetical protein M3396_01535 [Actinomycetota bacterium]|nr:hypothetical protein [Actinomycetota bacterium]
MDDRRAVWCYAAARVALGAGFVVAPSVLQGWIGEVARRPGTKVLARAFGARDAALGLGTLMALREGAPVRRWLRLAAAADAADALASLLGVRQLPPRRSLSAAAAAAAGAAAGTWLSGRVP